MMRFQPSTEQDENDETKKTTLPFEESKRWQSTVVISALYPILDKAPELVNRFNNLNIQPKSVYCEATILKGYDTGKYDREIC